LKNLSCNCYRSQQSEPWVV